LVVGFTQRNQWTANPSWTRSITEKLSFKSSLQLNKTTYENGLRLGLVDYELLGGTGGLLYEVTERDRIELSGSYVNFYTTDTPTPFRASIPAVNLSLTHAFTETLVGTTYGGPNFVDSTTRMGSDNIKNQSIVWMFGASLAKKFESTSIQVSLKRNIVPSAFGFMFQTDSVGVTISHDLSEALSASFSGSGFIVSSITGTFPDSTYFYANPKIAWKFLEW
jgi:hypothetical protein